MKLYIKEVAKKYGFSILELSQKLDIHRVSLSSTINNPNIKLSTLERLATVIGCNITEFFTPPTKEAANNTRITEYAIICPYCNKQINLIITPQPATDTII